MTAKEHGGLRFNDGKLMYDLIEPHQIEELAKVYTKGAIKYTRHNWNKGQAWSTVLASLKRHLAEFEKGVDFDKESGNLHMIHAAWNALAIVSFYKLYPQGDDRQFRYLKQRRVGLDIDEVLAGFIGAYCKKYELEIPAHWNFDPLFEQRMASLKNDKIFWAAMEAIEKPESLPFVPCVYITARPISVEWTTEWLYRCGFPLAPVVCVKTGEEKLQIIKDLDLDFFVDDNFKTFAHLNANGICCFLRDQKHNRRYDVGYKRVLNLADFANRFL